MRATAYIIARPIAPNIRRVPNIRALVRHDNFFSTNPPHPDVEEVASTKAVDADDSSTTEAVDPTIALRGELKEQREQMLRALADAENARAIARRDVENAQQFAVTKFAKSLLDVADNLSLALASIPAEVDKPRHHLNYFV